MTRTSYFTLKKSERLSLWRKGLGRRGSLAELSNVGITIRTRVLGWRVLRTRADQVSFGEAVLPAEVLRLRAELGPGGCVAGW